MSDEFPMKYQHIERIGKTDVQGIYDGEVYIFPKLDGTNCCIWYDDAKDKIRFGSRNQEIQYNFELEPDGTKIYKGMKHQGFEKYITDNYNKLHDYFVQHKDHIIYGEWLKKHTISTYLSDAWNKFYVFDIYKISSEDGGKYPIHYNDWAFDMEWIGIDFIPCMKIISPRSDEQLEGIMKHTSEYENTHLMQAGHLGEGVVAKRYDYKNIFGRTVWAKYVREEFKEKSRAPAPNPDDMSDKVAEKWCTDEFILKEYAKYKNAFPDEDVNRARLIETVIKTFWSEEAYDIAKKIKYDINMQRISKYIQTKIKQMTPELGW